MEADVRRQQEELFERMPVPRAVMKLVLPTIAASLVTVLYSLGYLFCRPARTAGSDGCGDAGGTCAAGI